jgi:K+-sensing histidine kinase KdpD
MRPSLLRTVRAPLRVGVIVAALAVIGATAAIYPLKHLAPVVSLSVVYLPAVLLVSVYWGLGLGLATSLASAAAFNSSTASSSPCPRTSARGSRTTTCCG